MFFFGIFGIEAKQKELRNILNTICKSCNKMSSYKLIKIYSYFHIFFIPVFKWGKKYYLVSRCCGSVFEIPEELGEKLEKGYDSSIDDYKLKPIDTNHSYGDTLCPSCGSHVDPEFLYCPYCGNKIK